MRGVVGALGNFDGVHLGHRAVISRAVEEARSRGVFGAPTFFAEDGEMFWGNDRLEQALAWASGERPAAPRS